MARIACLCGACAGFLPAVPPTLGAVTICRDCGRAYRVGLVPIEWPDVEQELSAQPSWVLDGFEEVRRAAPNPGRLAPRPRLRLADRLGALIGFGVALLLLAGWARWCVS